MMISVCVPVYNGAETLLSLIEKTKLVFKDSQYDFEVVLVNDGSQDNSDEVCINLAKEYNFITYICLRKNFGEHNAVMCALNYVKGDVAVIIDDDFQNPPEEIFKLVSEIEKGYDVVYAKYLIKKHSFFRNMGSKFNDVMATFLLKKPRNLYLCSFKAVKKSLIDEIIKYSGPFPYIDGIILRVTDSISAVVVRHDSRKTGKSNYTLSKLISLWLNMFINFSIKPLRIISLIGILTSFFSFILFIKVLIERFLDPSLPAGWASVIIIILFLGGIQLFSLGLIGEYIGKTYLDINGTPQWIIKKIFRNID